jgi:hypothetical protein
MNLTPVYFQRHAIAILMTMLTFNICTSQTNQLPTSEDKITIDVENIEYKIFNILLTRKFLHGNVQLIVVRDSTRVDHVGDLKNELEQSRRKLTGLTQEVIDDFISKNQRRSNLKPQLDLDLRSILISDQELDEIFDNQDRDGWQLFYNRYPNSAGIITLSRVGLNRDKNLALVYLGNQYDRLAGEGFFILLSNNNGAWMVEKILSVWVS